MAHKITHTDELSRTGRRACGLAFTVAFVLALTPLILSSTATAAVTFAESGPGNPNEAGFGAGQVNAPEGLAVNQTGAGGVAAGTLYLADKGNYRVDEFDSAGQFVLAFGFGVRTGAAELQTCTAVTGCLKGLQGPGAGAMRPDYIAVDPSSGNVYVSDATWRRVTEFTPSGEFLLEFGNGVDTTPATSHPDLCTKADLAAGDTCGEGSRAGGPGNFFNAQNRLPLAFDPSGELWVGDLGRLLHLGRLLRFTAAGEFISELALPTVPGEGPNESVGEVDALAIDASSDFYLIREGENTSAATKNVASKLGPGGETIYTFDPGGDPRALALDSSGDLFLLDASSGNEFTLPHCSTLEFDAATGAQLERFGDGEMPLPSNPNEGEPGIAFGDGAERLYYTDAQQAPSAVAEYLEAPPLPGPLLSSASESASAIGPTTATLGATLNPESNATSYRFEYISDAAFKANEAAGHEGFTGAVGAPVPDGALPASFEYEPVKAALGALALIPETTYHFRLSATNSAGSIAGPGETFQTKPSIEIIGTSALSVSATGAVLEAQLDPLGVAAGYRVQYGPTAAYGAETSLTTVSAGTALVPVLPHLAGLEPSTTYHYRILATDERGGVSYTVAGPDVTLTTQAAAFTPGLPDGRGWEQVTPTEKRGATIAPISQGVVQAAADGEAITYIASSPTEPEPSGYGGEVQVLSTRSGTAWSSLDIATRHSSPEGVTTGNGGEYRFFSTDLSLGLVEPRTLLLWTRWPPKSFPPIRNRPPISGMTSPARPVRPPAISPCLPVLWASRTCRPAPASADRARVSPAPQASSARARISATSWCSPLLR